MRTPPRPVFRRVHPILAAVLISLVPLTAAQAGEIITATARVKSSGGVEASAPVTVVFDRFSTDAERDQLLAALKQRGSAGVRDLLLTWNPIGAVRVGGTNTAIKYVYARTTGDGRLITAVTGSPIGFIGAGVPGAQVKTGFDLGFVLLDLTAAGPGRGELVPAAKIRLNEQGALVTEDYSADVIQLANVAGK